MKIVAWVGGGLVALALLGLAGFGLFREEIARAVFDRAVTANLAPDRLSELPDGLHVFVCGSGGPMADPDRAGPCLAVLAGDKPFLFDMGSGAMRRLGRMGFPIGRTERLFLTHLHSDHLDGVGEFLLQEWVGGTRTEPVIVAGPRGTEEVIAGFRQAYRIDQTYRTAHHGEAVAPPSGFGAAVEEIDLGVGGRALLPTQEIVDPVLVYETDDITIEAFPVSHAPAEPAFGFRIRYKDRTVVISGDTAFDRNVIAAAVDSDVLFHEALDPEMVLMMRDAASSNGLGHIAKIMQDILDYHTSPEGAAEVAEEAGVEMLVLYHLIPPMPSRLLQPLFLGDAEERFEGPIVIAEDGLVVSLPAGSEEIDLEQKL